MSAEELSHLLPCLPVEDVALAPHAPFEERFRAVQCEEREEARRVPALDVKGGLRW